jgi:hypothetical protein
MFSAKGVRAAGFSVVMLAVFLGISPLGGVEAMAQSSTYHWQAAATGGNTADDPNDPNTWWNLPANWTEGAVPGYADSAVLNPTTPGRVYAQDANVASCIVDGPSADATLNVTGGSFYVNEFKLGGQDYGQAQQTDGKVYLGKALYLGVEGSGSGTYTLSGGSLILTGGTSYKTPDYEYVGYQGTGEFIQNGGTNSISSYGALNLGYSAGSTGVYRLSGGQLITNVNGSVVGHAVGYSGAGYFIQTGGTFITRTGQNLNIGYATGSTGSYLFSGGSFYGYGGLTVNPTGTFRQTGGTFGGGIGFNTGSSGAGAAYLEDGVFDGGVSGSGWMHQTGGLARIGGGGSFTGNWDLCSGTLSSSFFSFTDSYKVKGKITQSGGNYTVDTTNLITKWVQIDPNGSYNLSGGTLAVTGQWDFEDGSAPSLRLQGGSFVQSGGVCWIRNPQITSSLYGMVGGLYVSPGSYFELSGGRLVADCYEKIGYGTYSGTARFLQTGGVNLTQVIRLGYYNEGSYELQGGSINAPSIDLGLGPAGWLTQTGGKITGGIGISNGKYSMSGGIAELDRLGMYSANGRAMELSGGSLSSRLGEFVGGGGTCTMAQSGGINSTTYLELGNYGRYELSGGSLRIDGGLNIRPGGALDLAGSALTVNVAGNSLVNIPRGVANAGAATLNIGANSLLILPAGSDPNGPFKQVNNAGLTHIAGSTLTVPAGAGFAGWGEIDDFVFCGSSVTITARENGWIDLNRGITIHGLCSVDLGAGVLKIPDGYSEISGKITSHYTVIGGSSGILDQYGGSFISLARPTNRWPGPYGDFQYGALKIGAGAGSTGTYRLNSGVLLSGEKATEPNVWTNHLGFIVGEQGSGSLIQSGGTHIANSGLYLGRSAGGSGTYRMTGGSADISSLYIGDEPNGNSFGRLELLSPEAKFVVRGVFKLGRGASIAAASGATLQMTGGSCRWQNVSTNPSALDGLGNMGVVFQAQGGTAATFEVAGRDLGATPAGFGNNFALAGLTLGGPDGAGRLRLVDGNDNQPDCIDAEALYVDTLVLNQGAVLDCNGLNLYYRNGGEVKQFFRGDCDLDGQVGLTDLGALAANWEDTGACWADGDFSGDGVVQLLDLGMLALSWEMHTPTPSPAPVPEPATLALLAGGGLALLKRGRSTAMRRRGPIP